MSQVSFSQFMQCKLCGTEEAELRRRVLVNGSVQIVYQCLTCGRAATNAIAKSSVRNADSLPDWDEAAQERYNVRHEVQRLTERQQEKQAWLQLHNIYLRSPEWRKRRALVMARANGICEGCRSNTATQVHHLTYDHWKCEFLWELVAICDDCHALAHANPEEAQH